MDFAAHASSFGSVADLYDRIRPRYPVPALRWALYLVSDQRTRAGLEQRVRALLADRSDDEEFELPYLTYTYRTTKLF